MTSWTLTLPGGAVTVIVPAAVVLIPLSLKLKPVGVGDGVGLGLAAGAGEGDEEAVLPVPPQADATRASAAIATHLFKFAESPQICSWRYPSRLLDRPRPLAPLTEVGSPVGSPRGFLRPTPAGPAGPTPHQVTKAEKDQDGADRAHESDEVIDRGHEVVRGVG